MPLRSWSLLLAWAALLHAGCTCCHRHAAPPPCPCGYPPSAENTFASLPPWVVGPGTAEQRLAPRPEYLPPASSSGIEPTRLGEP
jgi:hypothetical protein